MVSGCRQFNCSLAQLDDRRELLLESIKECITTRDYYTSKNEAIEKDLERLGRLKDDLIYIKDVLLKDLYRININSGKTRKLYSQKLEEFHRKSCTMKMENLPSACQLKELMQSNEKLLAEQVKLNETLDNIKEEYSKVFNSLENKVKMKVIEFVKEFSEMMKRQGDKTL